MAVDEQMAISAFLYPTGYHVAAWRHPDVPADAGIDARHYIEITRIAERGKFDFIFLPDSAGIRGRDMEALSRTAVRYVAQLEPFTLMGALAVSTSRIGLTATVSSSYNEPYHVARKIASVDHMTGGRAGWNLVTSQNPEEAFNFDAQPDHDTRYARAAEFAEVVRGLWDSWEDGAFVRDKEAGLFFRPEGVVPLDYRSERFKVRGPLNMPRSPQGHPVTLQAGSSEAGKELGASSGEVIFTAQPTLQEAQAFYKDLRSRLARYGRAQDEVRVLPGVFLFVGRTRQEARDKFEQLQELIDPVVGLGLLSSELGHVDLSGFPLDGPLPPLPPSNAGQGRHKLLVDLAAREQLTLRQLSQLVDGSRGHWQPMGSASDVADELQEWYENDAADGFMIMAPALPAGLSDFVDLVVPELQRRGLFRTDYRGRTLRDHLGLARPAGRVPQ
ncbi:LLM class flavin-dependent oxidoreductase [Streptomyces olivaceus]|uniref:LLM class flavin-dependent oxidoreductase n=1 Tax=Streptomyces olivaceus TaxID=47716 RepID=UPI001CD011B8|nr:LLM class flavin-dependent oxidoreductase [Streptomyces olivaceus]MBZ6288445.1 LLM class flavin-dependent oxidoreductase [Streptomyces olivaceus]